MRETILVADPNINFLDQTRTILENQNYQFIQAVNGEDARVKLEQNEIDFLLVNYALPSIDGPGLCHFIREELQRPIPVALMVGQGEAFPSPEALELAEGLLTRPMRPQELLNCIHHLRIVRYFLQENMTMHERLAEYENNGTPAQAAPPPAPEPTPAAPPPKAEPDPDDSPLYPMTWFRKLAALEVKRAIRFHHPLSLLLLAYDLTEDFLETASPSTLELLSNTLAYGVRDAIRDIDIPVQFSRDHILILLPNTDIEGAIGEASRIKEAISEILRRDLTETYGPPPTISIGATTSSVQDIFKFTDLLRDATRALREVRANGGDGVFYC